MKGILAVLLAGVCCLPINAEMIKCDSFEDGVPKHWLLQGKGKLSIDPWHYKLGKKSLQWDFNSGDVIRINNTLGDINMRGGRNNACFSTFGIWIYCEKPMPGKSLRFEFREDEKDGAYFDFPLNFKGWQCAFVKYSYENKTQPLLFNKKVSEKTNNIRIHAPENTDGRIMIDSVIYNGLCYYWFNFVPRETPWEPPVLDEKKFPVPQNVSAADLKAIEAIEPKVKIGSNAGEYYKQTMELIEKLNIVEDEHGIRGTPIVLPRGYCRNVGIRSMFAGTGVKNEELRDFTDMIVLGTIELHYRDGIMLMIERCLSNGINAEQYRKLSSVYVKLWKYLLDQGINASYNFGGYYPGYNKILFSTAIMLREGLFKHKIMKEVWDSLQCPSQALFAPEAQEKTMDYYMGSKTLYDQVFLYSNEPRRQLQALHFLSDKLSREITGDYGACGFKDDGCGYHNTAHAVDYMQGALRTLSTVIRNCANTSFALSDAAYERIKKIALRSYFYTQNLELPQIMQGTGVFESGQKGKADHSRLQFLPIILKNLAMAGKDGLDRELAQAYINLKPDDTAFAEKYKLKPGPPPQGNISMPYATMLAQRRDNWLAVAGGSGPDMRERGNHYNYHIANGPLELMGKGGFFASGNQEPGWDWNRANGTTILYIPELSSIKYIHSGRKQPSGASAFILATDKWYAQYRLGNAHPTTNNIGNGGISWRGINGCYRNIFKGDRLFNSFRGIKSYFMIDDRIYALGSNLTSCGKKYQMQTTLYQKVLKTNSTPSYVDGREIKTFPEADKALDKSKAHYLLDPQGNGYYIPANQDVYVARKLQHSRDHVGRKETEGNFATAWLNHGYEAKEAKYDYVVLPYCGEKKLSEFIKLAENGKAYEILQQSGDAHIIHDLIDGFYAGIFFNGATATKLPHVAAVERACQIMYLEGNKKLEIAVGDPNPHRKRDPKMHLGNYGGKSELTPLKVTFDGSWKLERPVEGVRILNASGNKTVIEFACIHGRDFNFTLIE